MQNPLRNSPKTTNLEAEVFLVDEANDKFKFFYRYNF
jgi:hypothetical protein